MEHAITIHFTGNHDDQYFIFMHNDYNKHNIYVGNITQNTSSLNDIEWTSFIDIPSNGAINSTGHETTFYGFACGSKCYSSTAKSTYFMRVNAWGPTECSRDIFLYKFYPEKLVYNNTVVMDKHSMAHHYAHAAANDDCWSDYDHSGTCIATNADNFDVTHTVFIIWGNSIFVYNVSSRSGYFSPHFYRMYGDCTMYGQTGKEIELCKIVNETHSVKQPACLFDKTGKYIFVADQNALLWRYDIVSNEILSVSDYTFAKTIDPETPGSSKIDDTLNKLDDGKPFYYSNTYDYSTGASMIALNDGFILYTSISNGFRDYIFLPNLTEAVDSWKYPQTKTKYIDTVCAGREHQKYHDWIHSNPPLYVESVNKVFSFGGKVYTDIEWRLVAQTTNNGEEVSEWQQVYNETETKQIRYYSWLNDYNLIINWTESISFGDSMDLNVFLVSNCDLSDYHWSGNQWMASNHNPIYIEIQIKSDSNSSLDISKFLYIMNATNIDDSIATYTKCYLCDQPLSANGADWKDAKAEEGSGCGLCSEGLQLGSLSESVAGKIFTFDLKILRVEKPGDIEITLDATQRNLTILECRAGSGTVIGSATIDCNVCPFNQFTLQQSMGSCMSCRGVSDGLFCEGGNKTDVTYNYWVAAWDRKEKEFKPFYDIEATDKIITALCPPNYCCQDVNNGCEYLSEYLNRPTLSDWYECADHEYNVWMEDLDGRCYGIRGWFGGDIECESCKQWEHRQTPFFAWTHNTDQEQPESGYGPYLDKDWIGIAENGILCAFGRDVDVPLCGACLKGWSELLGTTQCGSCADRPYWYLGIIATSFCLTLFFSWYIIFIDSKPVHSASTQSDKQLLIEDDSTGFQILLFKPILYYFQSLSPILDTRGIKLWISPVLSIFSFSFDSIGGKAAQICWSDGLNACSEILINLLLPSLLMVHLVLPRFCVDKKGYGVFCCFCCKKKKICCSCCKDSQTPYYSSAFFRVLLITIGAVLNVCFKYLTFAEIEEKTLMFYCGDTNAFGGWWFAGFFGVLLVLIAFGWIYKKIKDQKPKERYSTHSTYRKFVQSFKEEYWFWEFILFSRRFCISCFTAFQFVGGGYTNYIFGLILIIYLMLQIHYVPFSYSRVNKIESLCMFLLIASFIAANFIHIDDGDAFVGWMLSLWILIPLLIVIYYAFKLILHRAQWKQYQENDEQINNLDKILKRMPESFRNKTTEKENMEERKSENEDAKKTENNDSKQVEMVLIMEDSTKLVVKSQNNQSMVVDKERNDDQPN